MNTGHIYHLDLSMIFDHFSVVHIHVHCFDDVADMMMMMNDEKMNDDHDHPLTENSIDIPLIFKCPKYTCIFLCIDHLSMIYHSHH